MKEHHWTKQRRLGKQTSESDQRNVHSGQTRTFTNKIPNGLSRFPVDFNMAGWTATRGKLSPRSIHKNMDPPPRTAPPLLRIPRFSCRKNAIFPGAYKIGAAISGPRIAGRIFTDTRIFLTIDCVHTSEGRTQSKYFLCFSIFSDLLRTSCVSLGALAKL